MKTARPFFPGKQWRLQTPAQPSRRGRVWLWGAWAKAARYSPRVAFIPGIRDSQALTARARASA